MTVARDLLSVPLRLYIYGLHGFFTEVIFTAIWDFVLKQDFRFHGEIKLSLRLQGLGAPWAHPLFVSMSPCVYS